MNIFNKPLAYNGMDNFIFISYSHESKSEVYKILHKLNIAGVRFWYDDSLERGVNWKEDVKEKIQQCVAVWFFFDKYFFTSQSLQEEVLLVANAQKKYSPVYYLGRNYKDIYKTAIKEDFEINDAIEDSIKSYFRNEITSIICVDSRDFIDELVREAKKLDAITDMAINKYKSFRKTFMFIGKDSLFTNSLLKGIQNVFSETENKIDIRLISSQSIIPSDKQLREYFIEASNNSYAGLIVRPVGEMSDTTFNVFEKICQEIPVVICDIDITPKQRERLGVHAPTFVCSDFEAGGRKIGILINRLCFLIGKFSCDVVVCTGPNHIPSAYIRSESIINRIRHSYLGCTRIIELNSLNNKDSYEQIIEVISDFSDNNRQDKTLILFAGNDNIAYYFAKKIENDTYACNINYRQIIILGYDGIVGTLGNSILEETKLDYATINTIPISQGEVAANTLISIVHGELQETFIKVEPKLLNKITIAPKFVKNLSYLDELLEHAGLFIFDLDGTLADTEPLHWEAYNILMQKKYGKTLTSEDIERYIGHNEISIYEMIEKDHHISINKEEFLRERLDIYLALVEKKSLDTFKWVKDFIKKYKNIPVLLLTSQVPRVVDYLLAKWNMDSIIPSDWRISAHDGNITKSEVLANPWYYIEDKTKKNNETVVVFEDSNHIAEIASNMGHIVIGISHQYNLGRLHCCDAIIKQDMKRGLFVGLSGLDMVCFIEGLPKINDKVKTSNYQIIVGGPALNASITYAKLGGNATLVTGLGNTPLACLIKDECKKYGVKIIDIMPENEIPNISFVAIDMNKSYRTIVSGQKIPTRIKKLPTSFFEEFDYCLYDCNLITYTEELVRQLSKHNILLVLDCGAWKDNIQYALHYASIAISSETFMSISNDKDIIDLMEDLQLKNAAKTRGGKNIIYKTSNEFGEIQVRNLENVNTLGAGDVFHGAFCYYYFDCNYDFKTSLTLSSEYSTNYIKNR